MFENLSRLKNRRTLRTSTWDVSGRNKDCWHIKPGETAVLADIRGAGRITHIWMTQKAHYRDCLLRFTWDDAPHASVHVPLGDFFCLGNGLVNTFQSALFTASTHHNYRHDAGVALNCYAPMPFHKSARIELINQSDAVHRQYFYIDYELDDEAREEAFFHAEFRRANPFGGWGDELGVNTAEADVINKGRQAWENNYVILETKGRGHYIGCNLSVANIHGDWWGEGDDMIWVDGYKWPPDLHGTGSEDYFNQAWCMQPNAFLRNGSSVYESLTLPGGTAEIRRDGGYQTSYVFHLENPVHFQKEIKVTMECGHANHLRNDFSSVAYWYAESPAAAVAPPPVAKRRPVRRDMQGNWIIEKSNQCPGPEIPWTPEMKRMKKRHAKSAG
ncbi:MAG TPA: DUF2961 domain-containing protein [Terrimicrobiaceae bacterium]|nr:DUF2961 domain-containing protein [Terrimicrobiaceae bacterium]